MESSSTIIYLYLTIYTWHFEALIERRKCPPTPETEITKDGLYHLLRKIDLKDSVEKTFRAIMNDAFKNPRG